MATPVCLETHKHVDARLDDHDDHLAKHDVEIEALKLTSVRTEVVVQQLCKKIDLMMTVFISAFMLSLGFILWYIQSLPR